MEKSIHKIAFKLNLSSLEVAQIVYKALQPEIAVSQTTVSTVQISIEDNILSLKLFSKRLSTLRALLNSYLRWIMMIKNILMMLNLD